MNKYFNSICNVVYGALSVVYFLIQIGTIRFSGMVENGRYTDGFLAVLSVIEVVLAVLGFALLVFNLKKSKEYKGLAKYGCNVATVCIAANCMFLLVNGAMSVFCFVEFLAALVIVLGCVNE
ncbi:MAG: hypothetical protein IJW37_07850 [Lachnospiraceae bacterium]|nr:hypothetical protein [Lachnospiraceae bacterium]